MWSLIAVIVAANILANLLNHFLGKTKFGGIGLLLFILPIAMGLVRPLHPLILICSITVGTTIFVLANRERYFPHRR
jgi:hypothetical protein